MATLEQLQASVDALIAQVEVAVSTLPELEAANQALKDQIASDTANDEAALQPIVDQLDAATSKLREGTTPPGETEPAPAAPPPE